VPVSRSGRLAAGVYLLLVLGAVMTWLIAGFVSAPDSIFMTGFYAALILTLPLGYLGYGVLATAAMALTGDGVLASVIMAVLILAVFMGAGIINVIAVRGLWRCCSSVGQRPRPAVVP
jgi:hypothetical protein